MRSKRRCSLCLQFALILGAGPVLHRPTSLVIHRLEWNHTDSTLSYIPLAKVIFYYNTNFNFIFKGFRAVARVYTFRRILRIESTAVVDDYGRLIVYFR
jgi:hypothetical protein